MAMASTDLFGMVALTGATAVTVALDVRYRYLITHLGRDAGGNDDANSAKSAWIGPTSTITCDQAVNDNQYELADGANVTVGPGIGTLYLKSTADADAVLTLVRIGTPTSSY
jgi:hypothetical protein